MFLHETDDKGACLIFVFFVHVNELDEVLRVDPVQLCLKREQHIGPDGHVHVYILLLTTYGPRYIFYHLVLRIDLIKSAGMQIYIYVN